MRYINLHFTYLLTYLPVYLSVFLFCVALNSPLIQHICLAFLGLFVVIQITNLAVCSIM